MRKLNLRLNLLTSAQNTEEYLAVFYHSITGTKTRFSTIRFGKNRYA